MRFVSRTRCGPEDTWNRAGSFFVYSICCARYFESDLTCYVRFSCVKSAFRLPTGAELVYQIVRLSGKLFFVVNRVPKRALRADIVKDNGKTGSR